MDGWIYKKIKWKNKTKQKIGKVACNLSIILAHFLNFEHLLLLKTFFSCRTTSTHPFGWLYVCPFITVDFFPRSNCKFIELLICTYVREGDGEGEEWKGNEKMKKKAEYASMKCFNPPVLLVYRQESRKATWGPRGKLLVDTRRERNK